MPVKRITQKFVDRLATTHKPDIYRDTEMTCFAVRLSNKGKITFIMEKKISGTRSTPRISLGTHPSLTVKEAKQKAAKNIQLCSDGIDPRTHKKEAQEAVRKKKAYELSMSITFEDVFEEFLQAKQRKDKTISDYRGTIGLYCGDWMKLPIRDIDHQNALDKYLEVKRLAGRQLKGRNGEGDRKESGLGQADKTRRYLSAIFKYARGKRINGERLISENPFDVIKEQGLVEKIQPRTRYLRPSEIAKLLEELSNQEWLEEWAKANVKNKDAGYKVIGAYIREHKNKNFIISSVRDYIMLSLFSGLRRSEVLRIKWSNVYFEDGYLTVKGTKNKKDHSIPLTKTIKAILENRRKEVAKDSIWVFQSPKYKEKHMVEPRFQIQKLCEELGFNFSPHVLRHTFATYGHEYGLDDGAIGRALNQASTNVTGKHYIHSTVEMIRHIFEKVEEQIRHHAYEEPIVSKMNHFEQERFSKAGQEFDDLVEQTKDDPVFEVEEGGFSVEEYLNHKKTTPQKTSSD